MHPRRPILDAWDQDVLHLPARPPTKQALHVFKEEQTFIQFVQKKQIYYLQINLDICRIHYSSCELQ